MTIRPDHWIARMAREHGMIEPFEEGQVREGVISYGLSSFGYDIRVADEFKVFTDVYSVVVDPKSFDPRSFVDIRGEGHCTIPPNSFALARTLEHFSIPRDVLVICLGKSTYARCLRGDTRVALVDGTSPTLEEMTRGSEEGRRYWGYALGSLGRIIVVELIAPRFIGCDALLEIELDNGELVHATPDHEFIRRDGRLASADELRPGDSLMPLYRELIRGYESVYQPLNGHLYPTHRLSDEWNLRNGVYADVPGTHRHHRDHDRRNNAPWNIERMPASEHIRHHNSETFGESFDAAAHGDAVRLAIALRMQDADWRERFTEQQRRKMIRFWTEPEYAEARRALLQKRVDIWTEEARARAGERMRAHYADPSERQVQGARMRAAWASDSGERRESQREVARGIKIRDEFTEPVVVMALIEAGTIRGAARKLGCDRSVFRRFPDALEVFRRSHPRNHKIVRIRSLRGDHDVYCVTVPEAGNFALSSGVFTRNCGIIVNVTPLEPEWRGHLTLEISNTTPLPAKVYANEGIAQLVFFQSDEPPTMTYAQRQGKYQDQRGVTLPRM